MRLLCIVLILTALTAAAQPRQDISLNAGWRTTLIDSNRWQTVDIPHNWDDYAGYRRLLHGNLHGSALYTKIFKGSKQPGKRYFLWFEGVGSYATVRLNGLLVGSHAGGRTSFTLDITDALKTSSPANSRNPNTASPKAPANSLEVLVDHPANIRDLPWVCGGCSDERGFSEGSQPFGIFRPVHLIVTNESRIEPFGVHIWNDTTVNARQATLFLETEIKNYSPILLTAGITQQLRDKNGTPVAETRQSLTLTGANTIRQQLPDIKNPHLWSPNDPYLYTLVTTVTANGRLIDQVTTPYGIRRIHWVDPKAPGPHPFTINGEPIFLNGIAEYEHRIGNSHAFTHEEITARVRQIKAAGFNAFRDAHQPHNLFYQHFWDSLGICWWPQYSAHIWFDSKQFRENFKQDLVEWVKERRNSPSIILWGLQNESKLPEDFAKECVALIRGLDPTASGQRLIVTCNGGTGTDWDVPQNWTGTYGGDPKTYGADLIRQILVGEYGAWRTAGLHGDTASSEDRMTALMEQKIRLADSVKTQVAGHFAWLYSSHDNPGRVQSGEGLREIDRIGPVNYKGLLTEWEEPLDGYYLYRANFTDPHTDPNVYIVSHTWPDRFQTPGIKSNIIVYSNCDTLELFTGPISLGKRTRHGIGTHFQWDSINIQYNLLTAIAYHNNQPSATDQIFLNNLPPPPGRGAPPAAHSNQAGAGMPLEASSELLRHAPPRSVPSLRSGTPRIGPRNHPKNQSNQIRSAGPDVPVRPIPEANRELNVAPAYNYLYRINCGGPTYTDRANNTWLADTHYTGLTRSGAPTAGPGESHQAATTAPGPITPGPSWGSTSWTDDYKNLPPFFASQRQTSDPIAGTTDAPLFQTFRYGLQKLGYTFPVQPGDYRVELYFIEPWLGTGGPKLDCTGWRQFDVAINGKIVLKDLDIWKEAGRAHALKKVVNVHITGNKLDLNFPHIASGQALISAIAIATKDKTQHPAPPSVDTAVYHAEPAYDARAVKNYKGDSTQWNIEVGVSDKYALTVKYRWQNPDAKATLEVRLADGTLINTESVNLKTTLPGKWNYISTTTGTMINAGRYKITLIVPTRENLRIDELQVQ